MWGSVELSLGKRESRFPWKAQYKVTQLVISLWWLPKLKVRVYQVYDQTKQQEICRRKWLRIKLLLSSANARTVDQYGDIINNYT